eukprot:TRINITY_DN7208_c0_g1_i3.p1 TRINITY_DN7208_c0_g1~~TRINITY_DN7208_c0_g1_i3.p1  ORF type:complete len:587 (-),score=194.33 TRINITY_DN7208_c0_g1_i3:810-2570(-)
MLSHQLPIDLAFSRSIVSIKQSSSCFNIIPSPTREYYRAHELKGLKSKFDLAFKKAMGVECDGFSRWIYDQLAKPFNTEISDPVLRYPQAAIDSPVIYREILSSLPCKLKDITRRGRMDENNWLNLRASAERLCNKLVKNFEDEEDVADLKKEVSEAINAGELWMDSNSSPTESEYVLMLTDIHTRLQAIMENAAKPVAESLCVLLVEESNRLIQRVADYDVADEDMEEAAIVPADDDDTVRVVFDEDSRLLRKTHLQKLQTLFLETAQEVPDIRELFFPDEENQNEAFSPSQISLLKSQHFPRVLYALLCRYEIILSGGAGNAQAAAPEKVFEIMHKHMKCAHEGFASPFNCFFHSFNSAFYDIDRFFGSQGSFFDFLPSTGSFEVGPPYTEEVMDRTALHVDAILDHFKNSEEEEEQPLSFIVFVPEWIDPPAQFLLTMQKSEYLRWDYVAPARRHVFIDGLQHQPRNTNQKRFYRVPHGTHIFVLQNDAGAMTYPVTAEFKVEFKEAMNETVDFSSARGCSNQPGGGNRRRGRGRGGNRGGHRGGGYHQRGRGGRNNQRNQQRRQTPYNSGGGNDEYQMPPRR